MKRVLISCLLVAGCMEEPARHANTALGVSDFTVHSSASELDIAGVDSQGTMLARFHLRTGMVLPEEWDAPTIGRELTMEIHGKPSSVFASAGLAPLMLPPAADPQLNAFVRDPFVAEVLSRWGVAFADRPRADEPEAGYAQCSLTGGTKTFPTPCTINMVTYGATSSCIEVVQPYLGHPIWQQKVVCADPAQSRAVRTCTDDGQGTPTPCGTAGANGCHNCPPPDGSGGWTECSSDSCVFNGGGGGGGSCNGTACLRTCSTDDDCCLCGGFCGTDGLCVY